ncbi:MAG: hypothetical protein FGM39_11950 [Phycisphaerales bacterium]|nr:hypothetical protein [Phycisphaerales bacterium]
MKSPAMRAVCIGAAVACAQAAQAYVTITYNDQALWASANPFVGGPYYTVYEDDMSTANLVNPSYAESSLPSSSQGFWTATPLYTGSLALGGSGAGSYLYAERGVGSTGYQGMLFGLNGPTSLSTGLYGVGAYVRLFDASGNAIAGTVQVAINGVPSSSGFSGQAAVVSVGSSGGFVGFWIDNTNLTTWITSLWVGSAAAPRVAVDTLYLGVPAPGALALLGAAGLVGSRRRRG